MFNKSYSLSLSLSISDLHVLEEKATHRLTSAISDDEDQIFSDHFINDTDIYHYITCILTHGVALL